MKLREIMTREVEIIHPNDSLQSAAQKMRDRDIGFLPVYEGDELIGAQVTDGSNDIILGTHNGQAIRFHENTVRPMGRAASGVRGVRLRNSDYVVGMVVVRREGTLLVVSEKGYGKRSNIQDYRVTNRGGVGIITLRVTDKVGPMIAIMEVVDLDDLMIVTSGGMVIRQPVAQLRTIGRATQGVRLIRIDEDDSIADIDKLIKSEEDEEGGPDEAAESDDQEELF